MRFSTGEISYPTDVIMCVCVVGKTAEIVKVGKLVLKVRVKYVVYPGNVVNIKCDCDWFTLNTKVENV